MNENSQNVQNLDDENLDRGGKETGGPVRQFFRKRLREIQIRVPGITVNFRQQDEQGTIEK